MITIYYFTRTGNSKKIASDIAGQTGGQIRPITDGRSWKGIIGFIAGGYYASSRKKLPADYEPPSEEDSIYLCFPVWAGKFPPAVRSFIDETGRSRITAVPSSKGSLLSDREGFAEIIDKVGGNNDR